MEEYQKIKTTIKDWDEADRPREKLMSLGRQSLKKLRVYAGSEHEQTAQQPEVWNF